MKNTIYRHRNSGEALVTLLFFIIIAVTITSAAVVVSVVNTRGTLDASEAMLTHQIAESGAEEAILRLIRNPEYMGGSLSVGGGEVIITVTGDENKSITSQAQMGEFFSTVQVETTYNDNVLIINSWREIF